MKGRLWTILCLLVLFLGELKAQQVVRLSRYLYKPLDINVRNAPLGDVLEGLGRKGNFYFSYSSVLIPQDSLVTISMRNTPIAEILDQLLQKKFEYRESPGYLILRPAFNKFEILPETIRSEKRMYLVSGVVKNEKTGQPVQDVSIYEKRLLRSTLTDRNGHFRLRIRGEHPFIMLSASRENYRDTTLVLLSGIHVGRENATDTSIFGESASEAIENSRLGRFFVSSRQKMQSLNIPDFLANTPFQASLVPGLSSQGLFSSQVVNKFSLNVLGGYTAGVRGVEIAGLFNINKGQVHYFQAAGLSNLVGGSMNGVQAAGLVNTVLKNTEGVQIAGIGNTAKDTLSGTQVAGVFNAGKVIQGVQIAGVSNYARTGTSGAQVSGVLNISRGRLKGAQIGLLNVAKESRGLQVGLINMAHSSTGYSIGLINWVTRGYHKISFTTNETFDTNLSLKTGNSRLYTTLLGGATKTDTATVYAAGLGLGHDFIFSRIFSISAEASTRYVYRGDFNKLILLHRGETNLQVRIFKPITLFAGPSYNLLNTSDVLVTGTGVNRRLSLRRSNASATQKKSWIGWNLGITLF